MTQNDLLWLRIRMTYKDLELPRISMTQNDLYDANDIVD